MQGLAEMINISDLGVSSVGLLPNKTLRPGMLFAEVLFTLAIASSHTQQIQRYLTQSGLRVVVATGNNKNLTAALPSEQLCWLVETASKPVRQAVVKDYREQISALAEQAETIAREEMAAVIDASLKQIEERSQIEVARLKQLQQRNTAISDGDIDKVVQHYRVIAEQLQTECRPRFSAIRLLVSYRPD